MTACTDQENTAIVRNGNDRRLLSKPIHRKGERNCPPSTNQGLSTAKLRSSHAVCTLRLHSPTSPCTTLSVGAEVQNMPT